MGGPDRCRRDRPWYRRLVPADSDELASFFAALVGNGDKVFFHPHPLTRAEAVQRALYRGEDLYYIQRFHGRLSGYGMLRGWDEGFAVPSLGLAVHPGLRGRGLAEDFLCFLRDTARRRGAERLRLTVHRENEKAIRLYRKMGFRLQEKTPVVLEGYLALRTPAPEQAGSPASGCLIGGDIGPGGAM